MRTGQNLNETVLTPTNVNSSSFGKLFTRPLDGQAIASPLYVENVSIPGQGAHNVVYVATEHDSVYAYDADGRSTTPLWKDSFINPPSVTTVPAERHRRVLRHRARDRHHEHAGDRPEHEHDVRRREDEGGSWRSLRPAAARARHHDRRGEVRRPGRDPGAACPGPARDPPGGQVPFDPLHENQRTGLLLLNGVVYFGFASHGDVQPYHGWILGYNATTLQRTLAFNVTPNQEGAGVWMSGGGLAADSTGSMYYITGDGEFDGNTGGPDWGDSYVKMTPAGVVQDYFTPFNQDALNQGNHDLGSGGALLLPDQPGAHPHEMVSSGKDGTIYLVDRDNMGHYSTTTNNIVQYAAEHLPERHAGARATSARPSTGTATSSSARSPTRAGVQADEWPALDERDLQIEHDVPGPRRGDGRLRERLVERDSLGRPAQRHDQPGRAVRVRPDELRRTACSKNSGTALRPARATRWTSQPSSPSR